MIYIFDDKKLRQIGYNWSAEKFDKYSGFISPIYQYSEVQNDVERKKIFSKENIVLFHESFFDADFNKHIKDSLKIRRDLEAFAQENSNFHLAFFSGSKNERSLNKNVAYLPVSVLYQNLEEVIRQSQNGNNDLKYLLYGKSPNIEQEYLEKLLSANKNIETKISINKNYDENILIARTISNQLPNIITDVDYKILASDTDLYFHEKIVEWLFEKKYNKIIIPLCFGPSLSDFNGLRFASHIRCTYTLNQCTAIYIYSFIDFAELLNNECFDILKSRNVELIKYSTSAFENVLESKPVLMELAELPKEIAKLKLSIPKNYDDNHSISNEWAIYRWANAINPDNTIFNRIFEKVNTQLYFKYLSVIHPISEIPKISHNELKLHNTGQSKILYVDDDADKGWYELLCFLLSDINGINSIDYFGDDLKGIEQNEIVEMTLRKIKEEDIDLVILDFRLHPDDFFSDNINDVTGLILLKEIKELNPGIQIVIFSATNKVWNLLALQDAGADGFIIKESPEMSSNSSFTLRTLSEFINTIDECIERGFLKSLFNYLKTIKNRLMLIEDVPENPRFNNFLKKINIQFNVIFSNSKNIRIKKPISLDVVFLSCYTLLDLFKKYYLEKGEDHRYYLGFRNEELIRYNVFGNDVIGKAPFIPQEPSDKPGVFHVYSGLLKNYYSIQGVYDSNMYIKNFYKIRDYRNDYIHGAKQQFRKEEVLMIVQSLLPITYSICE